jgi:ATP-dependent exoDNAse (exonuclease V) alpha subunit
VERVTFCNPEGGFGVLRVKARGRSDLVTTVGHAAMISAGEWATASGEWSNDRTHGLQLRARFLKTSAPLSLEGVEKPLGSGMIRGVGPIHAERLVRRFGKDVLDVIEASPERLREAEGVGPTRAARITSGRADRTAQEPGLGVSGRGHPGPDPAPRHAPAQPAPHRRDTRQAAHGARGRPRAVAVAVRNVSGRRRRAKLRERLGATPVTTGRSSS